MSVFLWALGLSLLMQSCMCSIEQTGSGCMKWYSKGDDICCEACHPGHRLVKECGPNPKDLCTPCGAGRYTVALKSYKCDRCTQCVGAQVYVKRCTASTDTVCGCKEGLVCADKRCSYCKKCEIGQEVINGDCRPCPDKTFNDQTHLKCKPWSDRCPNLNEVKLAEGTAISDIKCVVNATLTPVVSPAKKSDPTEQGWPLYLSVVTSMVLIAICIIIISSIVGTKLFKKRQEEETNTETKTPIIRVPTDDPRTLIAVECSFHEAQQEQGSSSESLASKESSDQLIV
ncbi:tumor necrosis factor receptor superfamily member 9a [Centropristis striata]|uniref:tumor necrosis factor receptor superfamily member 9a n=1 Tax=Centropristis striata TaxID=184440 RepID=UPI0027E18226|nr:tumor necrosis factor receptor superfamily member 9a [Centropristis striata]